MKKGILTYLLLLSAGLLQAALPGLSENNVKILNTFNLRVFYMTTYAGCADDKAFYAEFDRRLAMAKEKLGLM